MGKSKLVFLVVLIAAFSVSGCYISDIKDICEAEMKCEGGNDADIDACVELWKGDRDAAKAYDCKDQFDDYLECYSSNGSCESDAGSDSYYSIDWDKCDTKEVKLSKCISKESKFD